MGPLFAEVPDWVVFIIATLGPAIAWGATWFAGHRSRQRSEHKEDQKGIVDHQEALIKRQGEEITKLNQRADNHDHLIQRLLQHVGYLEGIMTAKGEKFRPFNIDGSDIHRILPPEAKS